MTDAFDFNDPSTWHPEKATEDLTRGWFESVAPDDVVIDDRTNRAYSNVLGKFGYNSIPDERKSREADENVYKKTVILWTKVRNDKDISPHKVTASNCKTHIKRFPQAWKAFLGQKIEIDGTPLTELPGISDEQRMYLSFDGIRTVEDLSTLTDEQCAARGLGWRKHRDAAIAMVGAAPKAEASSGEIATMKAQMEAMQAQNARLMEMLQASQNGAPASPVAEETASDEKPVQKPRGRPRKKADAQSEAA